MENLTQAEYIDEPGRCPVCRGGDLDGGFVEIDNGTASQPVRCNDCEAEWTDTYTLTGYAELETP
jgi:formate dehydrogenase maturation protein FdhE